MPKLPSHMPTVPNCEVMPTRTVAKNDRVYIDIKTPGAVTEIKLPNGSVCVVYTPQEGAVGNARVAG